jgi:putative thioredoxin
MQSELNFQTDVLDASSTIPVVVDFWAEWCAPCKVLGPVLEKAASEAQGKWQLVKINTEQHPDLAARFRIQGIPAVKMFSQGEVIAEFVGALPESQIQRWLADNLPTRAKLKLSEAKAALDADESDKARALLEEIAASNDRNNDAALLLARLIVTSEPEKALNLVETIPPEDPLFNDAEKIKNLARLFIESGYLKQQAESSGNEPAWQHYIAGIDALLQQDHERALQEWIEALLLKPDIDNDGPRKACIALFGLLGTEHELTQKYHRRFTSALF